MRAFFNRINNLFWIIISLLYRMILPIKKGRIIMWSYFGKNYSCNPKAISDYILLNHKDEYDIIWVFLKGRTPTEIPPSIKTVTFKTLKYLYYLNSSEYIITNTRTFISASSWIKRKKQKYIMTWHSSMGLKCIEGDADIKSLGIPYVRAAKLDSKRCDLIISGSKARTDVIKRAFWYDGEILESGTPRNDILFDNKRITEIRESVFRHFNIPEDDFVILYAPTFRGSYSTEMYRLNWNSILESFENKFKKNCHIIVRLHPNYINKGIDTSDLINYRHTYDGTYYNDMQELLVSSNVLITDYSSSMFDYAYMKKIVFLYATDYKNYDRNTYFKLDSLPFPFSDKESELIKNIEDYNQNDYLLNLNTFLNEEIGSYESGIANETLLAWMRQHHI